MKNIYPKSKLLILFLALILSSCSTDSEEGEKETPSNDENGIEVDGKFLQLTQAFVHFSDDPEETEGADIYYHDILVASPGVYNQESEQFEGNEKSHFLDMTVTSSSPSNITDGAYTVNTWRDGDEFRMVWSTLESTHLSPSEIDMEGTVSIKQQGNEISLQFDDLTGENGEEINGSYSGEFKELNFAR